MSRLAARLLLLLATAAVVVGAAVGLFPRSVPRKSNPGYLDVLFENGLVVFAARLAVVAAAFAVLLGAAYVAASMIVRIERGQWLRRAGPFEAELVGAELSVADVGWLIEELRRAWQANEELERRLRRRDEEFEAASEELGRLASELAHLKGGYS